MVWFRRVAVPLLLLVLGACAAPSPQAVADREADAQATGAESKVTSPALAQASRPRVGERIDVPPLSDPHPPAKADDAPVQVDRSCRTDADCTVKNVGNCCGAMPACVNTNSPTDPAGVRARCASEGMASVCGFTEIQGCRCAGGQCVGAVAPLDPSQDPPVPVR